MRSRREPRLTDQPNQFTLFDCVAASNSRFDAGQVRIPACKPARMLDADKISVSRIPTGKCHSAVRDSYNRTARRSGIIRREMRAFRAEDWMHPAMCKTGTDAWGEFQRRSKKSALEGNTLLVVIRVIKQEAAILPAGIHELGGLNLAVLHKIPLM